MPLTQPTLNAIPFASNGEKNTIPNTAATSGAASMNQGFPPVTMIPVVSGGLPPSGKDFNGILNQLSQHQVWQNAGGMYKFDSNLCNAIDGYVKGAVLLSDDGLSAYISTVANNKNNPNTNMTGWAVFGGNGLVKLNNTLVSTATDEALTAAQGRALNDKFLGIDQSWVNVTSTKTLGTLYTNTTTKPRMVNISFDDTNELSPTVTVFVKGVLIIDYRYDTVTMNTQGFISFIVPAGQTYMVNCKDGTTTLSSVVKLWAELG